MIGVMLRLWIAFIAVVMVLIAGNATITAAVNNPGIASALGLWAAAGIVATAAVGTYRRRTRDRYGLTSVGVVRRFEREPATDTGAECRACEREITPGDRAEQRRWWREAVVGGAVVWRSEVSEGYYCEDHAHKSVRENLEPIPVTVAAPHADSEQSEESA